VKDSHVFDGERLYRDGKTWQICDVTDPLLRSIIDEAPLREDCDDATGWFGNGTWSLLKMVMKEKIARLAAGNGRDYDGILKAIVPTIPPFLTAENMMHVSRSADKEFIRISGLIRTTALHYARNSKRKKVGAGSEDVELEAASKSRNADSLGFDEREEDMEEEEWGDMDVDENQSEQEEGEEMQDE
jgi:general transcription factor 3C polypeptide 5 (transcription factor C subunit 1)